MEFLRKSGRVRPDALILGAQTENNLIVAERGVMRAKLTTKGKAAHAGNPSGGDKATLRMMRRSAPCRRITTRCCPSAGKAPRSRRSTTAFHGGHNTNVGLRPDRRERPPPAAQRKGEGRTFKELKAVIDKVGEPKTMYSVEF